MGWRFLFGRLAFCVFPLLFLTSAADAAEPASSRDFHACAAPEDFLKGRLALWQQRLELGGWNISIVMSHADDLKPRTLGHIQWDSDKKTAAIRVLEAAEYTLPCHEMLADMEFTVVHELIHLELSSLPRTQASRRDEEFVVNRIADALLQLDRQGPHPPAAKDNVQAAGLSSKPAPPHSPAVASAAAQ